jgi:TRAP-type transport system periplasmic protein
MLFRFLVSALLALAASAQAQQIVLKVHHPLPPTSTAHQKMLGPWCQKIAAESKGKLKCQIYPAMQLGGSPPQLYGQVKDGVADVIWTIPSYSAGRFPLVEVFELPFMTRKAEGASKAVWDYVQRDAPKEFKDVKLLAFHTHGGGVFHMVKKPITQAADLRGLKVRAPTRQTTKLLAALGASPVGMPVPQVADALAKGVIDGALLPYEVVPAIKANELTKFHSEPDPSQPTIHTSVFIFAMNKAKYESLPPELRKVIDDNSGAGLSAQFGRIFGEADVTNRKILPANSVNVISKEELERWKKQVQSVTEGWVREVSENGADGRALLARAQSLIAKYSGQ